MSSKALEKLRKGRWASSWTKSTKPEGLTGSGVLPILVGLHQPPGKLACALHLRYVMLLEVILGMINDDNVNM